MTNVGFGEGGMVTSSRSEVTVSDCISRWIPDTLDTIRCNRVLLLLSFLASYLLLVLGVGEENLEGPQDLLQPMNVRGNCAAQLPVLPEQGGEEVRKLLLRLSYREMGRERERLAKSETSLAKVKDFTGLEQE